MSPTALLAPPLNSILLMVPFGDLLLKSTKTRSSPSSPFRVTFFWAITSSEMLKVSFPPAASTRRAISNVPPLKRKTSSLSPNKTRNSASRTFTSISITGFVGSETRPSETEPKVDESLRLLSFNKARKLANQVAVWSGNN